MATSPLPILFSAKVRKVERTESPMVNAPVNTTEQMVADRIIPRLCLRKKRRFLPINCHTLIIFVSLNFPHLNDTLASSV